MMEFAESKGHLGDLQSYLYKQYQDNCLTDVQLLSSDGRIFHVHRIVITAASKYLHTVCCTQDNIGSFNLDSPANIVSCVLEFCYTGHLYVPSNEWNNLYSLATVLEMYSLLDALKQTETGKQLSPLNNQGGTESGGHISDASSTPVTQHTNLSNVHSTSHTNIEANIVRSSSNEKNQTNTHLSVNVIKDSCPVHMSIDECSKLCMHKNIESTPEKSKRTTLQKSSNTNDTNTVSESMKSFGPVADSSLLSDMGNGAMAAQSNVTDSKSKVHPYIGWSGNEYTCIAQHPVVDSSSKSDHDDVAGMDDGENGGIVHYPVDNCNNSRNSYSNNSCSSNNNNSSSNSSNISCNNNSSSSNNINKNSNNSSSYNSNNICASNRINNSDNNSSSGNSNDGGLGMENLQQITEQLVRMENEAELVNYKTKGRSEDHDYVREINQDNQSSEHSIDKHYPSSARMGKRESKCQNFDSLSTGNDLNNELGDVSQCQVGNCNNQFKSRLGRIRRPKQHKYEDDDDFVKNLAKPAKTLSTVKTKNMKNCEQVLKSESCIYEMKPVNVRLIRCDNDLKYSLQIRNSANDKSSKPRQSRKNSRSVSSLKKKNQGFGKNQVSVTKQVPIFVPKQNVGKCYICHKKYSSFSQHKKHMKFNHFVKLTDCTRRLFAVKSAKRQIQILALNQLNGNSRKGFHCKECQRSFRLYSCLYKHYTSAHRKVPKLNSWFQFYSAHRQKLLKAKDCVATKKFPVRDSVTDPSQPTLNKLVCNQCCKHFRTKGSLREHVRNIHQTDDRTIVRPRCRQNKPYVCSRKPSSNLNTTNEMIHYEINDHGKQAPVTESLFQCCECFTNLKTLKSLISHHKTIHGCAVSEAREKSGMLYCDITCDVKACSFSTNHLARMADHVIEHHPFIQYPCDQCGDQFQVQLMLKRHVHTSHLNTTRQHRLHCSQCTKLFTRPLELWKHEYNKHGITHEKLKFYYCPQEGCEFKSVSSCVIKKHQNKHETEKLFNCEYCGLKLKTEINLEKHVRKVHLRIRPYLCQVCGMNFGEESDLKAHMNACHSTEKCFKCDYCPYSTSVKTTFMTHVFTVHKVRLEMDQRQEFECPFCPYKTIRSHRHKLHLASHTRERAYVCKFCTKAFLSDTSLRTHVQWHHSNISHPCPHCAYKTKTTQKLNEHIRVQHQLKGVKPYKCPYCDFHCATSGNTRKHVMQKHKGQVVTYIKDSNVIDAARKARVSGYTLPLMGLWPEIVEGVPAQLELNEQSLQIVL